MTGTDAARDFVSPLRLRRRTAFTAVRFGSVALTPEVTALRRDLSGRLATVLARLPRAMWSDSLSTVDRYAGSAGDFYALFHVPVWSFLHWVPAAAREPLDPAMLRNAKTAQSLGLFLHLWDDHLCDGQLRVDPLRLQIRTEVWQAYTAAARALAASVAPLSPVVDAHLDAYLTAIHRDELGDSLAEFLSDFVRRVAIWTLTPQLLGTAAGGDACAAALRHVIESFSLAWRIVDDIQDIDLDAIAGTRSCVWHRLDDEGRSAWEACRAGSLAQGNLHVESWEKLSEAAWHPDCVPRLLADADGYIADAARTAAAWGWTGIAAELDALKVRRD